MIIQLSPETKGLLQQYLPVVNIRYAEPHEIDRIRQLHVDSRNAFEGTQYASVLGKEPLSVELLREMVEAGRLLVAGIGLPGQPKNDLAGFAAITWLDGTPHLEQLSVGAHRQGAQIGANLLVAVGDWTRSRGHTRVTLVTYTDIRFNAPWYRKFGYRGVSPERITRDLGPEHGKLLVDEQARDIDVSKRVVMETRFDRGIYANKAHPLTGRPLQKYPPPEGTKVPLERWPLFELELDGSDLSEISNTDRAELDRRILQVVAERFGVDAATLPNFPLGLSVVGTSATLNM